MFFLSCYAVHRALPSFPTRRSSDLEGLVNENAKVDPAREVVDKFGLVPADAGGRPKRLLRAHSEGRRLARRSEEHTSELQSRRDLVCRLLLEKKNDTRVATAEDSSR